MGTSVPQYVYFWDTPEVCELHLAPPSLPGQNVPALHVCLVRLRVVWASGKLETNPAKGGLHLRATGLHCIVQYGILWRKAFPSALHPSCRYIACAYYVDI